MIEYSDFKENRQIPMTELIYWIDKEFVQWRASELLGRELDEDEVERTTEFIEWGLSLSALEVIDIAINETIQEKIENEKS
jgi:hypothetical protein